MSFEHPLISQGEYAEGQTGKRTYVRQTVTLRFPLYSVNVITNTRKI